MINCEYCGAKIHEDDKVCLSCGRKVSVIKNKDKKESNNFFYKLLSFFIPVLGIVLAIINKISNSNRSKVCFRFSIFGFLFYILLIGLIFLFYFYILIKILT